MPNLRDPNTRAWCIAAVLVLAYALNAALAAWGGSSFTPYNGHFQNFWPLHRMTGGETPFVDFPVYLGAAQLYLTWPGFMLLGGDFHASSTVHDAFGFGLLALSAIAACRIAGIRWLTTACISIGFLAIFEKIGPGSNSALGIRSFAPFIAAGLAWIAVQAETRFSRDMLPGLGAGALVVWSADYGIPSAAALLFAMLVARPSITHGLRLLALAALALIAAATAASWGHPLAWLRVAVVEPSGMQSWYFNPDTAKKAFSLLDLPWWDVPLLASLACAGALCVLILRRVHTPLLTPRRQVALMTLLLASGGGFLLSCLAGTYDIRYALPMWRTVIPGVLVVIGVVGVLAWRRLRGAGVPPHFSTACAAAFALAMLVLVPPGLARDEEVRALHRDPASKAVPEMGGRHWPEVAEAAALGRRLGAEWDAEARPAHLRLRSLYGSVVSLMSGSRQSGPDYVIHALSPDAQAAFAANVMDRSVAAVETLDHDRVSWGIWNIRMTWPLYRELFTHWSPRERTEWSQIWRPDPDRVASRPPAATCSIATDQDGAVRLRIAAPEGMTESWWADAQVDLDTRFDGSWQPVVGKAAVLEIVDTAWRPRPGVEGLPVQTARWAWTLRLESKRVAMPVQITPGMTSELILRAHPEGRSSINASHCAVSLVRPTRETLLPALSPAPTFQARRARAVPSWVGQDGRQVVVLYATNPYNALRLRVGDHVTVADQGQAVVVWRDFRMVALQQLGDGDIEQTIPQAGLFTVTPLRSR